MFGNSIKIDDELFARAKKCAELAGYSSAEEFIQHIVEKEINQIMGPGGEDGTPEEIKKRLQGLGYIE